jgi:hypothetical protein
MRRLSLLLVTLIAFSVVIAASASPAGAYGGGASHDMWQIGISFNCTNPTPGFCDDFGGTGGFWGWGEFDRAGSQTWGNAQLTGCGHTVGGIGGPGGAGAGHFSIAVHSWYIGSNGNFWVTSETATNVGHGLLVSETFDPENEDTGIPATPGHYDATDLFGFSAPGLSYHIQVAFRPAK